ncbi:MAG: DUF2277 family protein [Actinomycetota bacterium]|nr:DUF2277 family protein [Actinomycetota bacterium]
MRRNITELRGLEPAATAEEIEAAVAEVTATTRLLSQLSPRRQPPKSVPPLRRPEVRARLSLA